MDLDLSQHLGRQTLTLTYPGGVKEAVELDPFLLVDELDRTYLVCKDKPDIETGAAVRKVLEAAGFHKIPEGSYPAHVAAAMIQHEVAEQKKRFETTLWGTGGPSAGLPPTTLASMLGDSPTPNCASPTA